MRSAAIAAGLLLASSAPAAPVAVRHAEGVLHGFLVLKGADGRLLADGELNQTSKGDRVTGRLTFRFRDGSVQEETTVYTERGFFRLVSDRLVQRGPSFPHDSDLAVDVASGRVTVRTKERDGKESASEARLELPNDIANGLVLTLLKNLPSDTAQASVGMVVAAPKPTLVRLRLVPAGEERFAVGGEKLAAKRWDVKLEIGGLKGLLAKLLRKIPPDTHVLVFPGEAPAFVRSEGPLFMGGAAWRIELTAPSFPDESRGSR